MKIVKEIAQVDGELTRIYKKGGGELAKRGGELAKRGGELAERGGELVERGGELKKKLAGIFSKRGIAIRSSMVLGARCVLSVRWGD